MVPTSTVPSLPFSLKSSVQLDTPSELKVIEHNEDQYTLISQGGVVSVNKKKVDFLTNGRSSTTITQSLPASPCLATLSKSGTTKFEPRDMKWPGGSSKLLVYCGTGM